MARTDRTYTQTDGGADGSKYFMDVAITPENVKNGKLWQRLNPKRFPQLGLESSQVSTVTLAITPASPQAPGQDLEFEATIAGGPPDPTGYVEFYDGTTVIGSARAVAGVATLTRKLAVAVHSITAKYYGDSLFRDDDSAATAFTTAKDTPTNVLTADDETPAADAPVELTATLAHASALEITGTVEFLDGVTSLGTVTVSGEVAVLTVAAGFAAGAHNITAEYSGDSNYEDAISNTLVVTAS